MCARMNLDWSLEIEIASKRLAICYGHLTMARIIRSWPVRGRGCGSAGAGRIACERRSGGSCRPVGSSEARTNAVEGGVYAAVAPVRWCVCAAAAAVVGFGQEGR